jgi:hypothetical protein
MQHRFLSFCFLCLLLLSACNDFLTEESPNDLNAETAITNAASAEAALTGIYSALQNRSYYGGQYLLMGEALSDNASTGGYSYISLDQLSARNVTPAKVLTEQLWIGIWRVVANCNHLLAALPKVSDLEEVRKKDIEAQALTLRALAHFDALRYFGEHWNRSSAFGIPLIQRVQTIEDLPQRATVQAGYDFVIGELEAALRLADPDREANAQLVHKATIQALLARVYLYAGDLSKAASNAEAVISHPGYALLPSETYADIFEKRRTSEAIFELAFDAQNRSDYNNLTYSRPDAVRPELFYMAAQSLNEFFKTRPGDVRADLLNFDPADNDVTITPDGRTQKYRGETARDNPAYILRLAEMYLIQAEALGKTAGLAPLNTLRRARGLSELAAADIADETAWEEVLLAERRAELNFEGHRYFDLARTGRYAAVIGTDAFRAALPIPLREISASEGRLTQTPGY